MDVFLSFLIWLFGGDALPFENPEPNGTPSAVMQTQERGDIYNPNDNNRHRLHKEIIIVVEDTHFKPEKGQ